jgi:hypothetical protein
MKNIIVALVTAQLFSFTPKASADYALVLKNGGRIVVQGYREDAGMIKFLGLGGEIGIPKDQIESIGQTDAAKSGGFNLRTTESSSPPAAERPSSPQSGRPQPALGKPPTAEEEKAKEEQEYQKKVKDITDRLRVVRDRYSQIIRGTTAPEPSWLFNEEQIRALHDDVISRFKDAQRNPSDPAPVRLLVPSPFSSQPPTVEVLPAGQVPPVYGTPEPYTERQKELSDLREQANRLDKEREKLINEMKEKNLKTGGLFLE